MGGAYAYIKCVNKTKQENMYIAEKWQEKEPLICSVFCNTDTMQRKPKIGKLTKLDHFEEYNFFSLFITRKPI